MGILKISEISGGVSDFFGGVSTFSGGVFTRPWGGLNPPKPPRKIRPWLIALTIFDEGLPKETRDLIAAKIGNLNVEEFEIKKPSLPTITAATAVSDFVGPRSRLVFDLLEVPTNFLLEEDWQLQPEYSTTKRILETFTPVNDSTDRALALATNYNSKITRNEESYQELLLVVEEHRKKFVITTKADLLNLY